MIRRGIWSGWLFLVYLQSCFFLINPLEDFTECDESIYFKCRNGRCISKSFLCDGEIDCGTGDSSDEEACHYLTTKEAHRCLLSEFQCSDRLCIPGHWACDGEHDCLDGSDESGCDTFKCDGFQCKSHNCIPKEWECDGTRDCSDNSDEDHCPHKVLNPEDCELHDGRFLCADRKVCINIGEVCNGHADCADGSDEGKECFNRHACDNVTCSHSEYCNILPQGAVCIQRCQQGYKFIHGNCEDVDECQNFGTCDQVCHNTIGGYNCTCIDGYEWVPEHKNCKAIGPEGLLLFSSNTQIRGYFINSRVYYQVAGSLPHATGIAYDGRDIYWTTIASGDEAIVKATEHGENKKVIVTSGIGTAEDLSIDRITGSLYFTDSTYKHIGVCSNDGLVCTVLHNRNIDKPRAITLHSSEGIMYWTDWGEKPMIGRSGMDGSQPFEFVTENIYWPNGLSLDLGSERLYWVDGKDGTIECIRLDGTDRRKIPSTSVKHPFSIEVFEDKIFWSDWENNQIEACNKFTGHDCHIIVKERAHKIYGLHIYHPALYGDTIANPCYEKHCTDLCLLSPRNLNNVLESSCACPQHKTLSHDSRTCIEKDSLEAIVVASGQNLVSIEHNHFGGTVSKTEKLHHLRKIGALAYDSLSDNIIISDLINKVIVKYNRKEKSSETLIDTVGRVVGMDVDYYGNNLYWVDEEKKTVEVMNLKTKYHKVLLRDFGNEVPSDIALVLESGFMFVACQSNSVAHIDRLSMDGRLTSRTHVVESHLIGPVSLFYDHQLARLLWADRNAGLIMTTDVEGVDRHKYKEMGSAPLEVTTLDNDVFWTTYGSNKIYWSNKLNPDLYQKEFTIGDITETDRMKLIGIHTHALEHKDVCLNAGNCSHMCLLSGKDTAVCACPEGMELAFNKESCQVQLICKEDEFKCKTGECIPRSLKCNGRQDCKQGEDEEFCAMICPYGDFACANGHQCVSHSALCDSNQDCEDGSDEYNCDAKSSCTEYEFQCDSGECIAAIGRCDTHDDCKDSSDERGCSEAFCTDLEFRCSSGSCIPKSWECDRQIDCIDGSDEGQKCHKQEECKEFTCENGHCVSMKLKCNGEDDCEDFSDELNCPTEHSASSNDTVISPVHEPCDYLCPASQLCFPESVKCDGHKDCPNGEDEKSCTHCNDEQFLCTNKKCIPRPWVCDNINDCGDNSDEIHCTNKSIEMFSREHSEGKECDGFLCTDSDICLSLEKTCDSHPDCPDGADEKGLCESGSCEHAGCSQKCQNTPHGPRCMCSAGYILAGDSKGCNDIDECQKRSTCSQLCQNTLGSYRCSCFTPYYVLRSDHTSCKAKGSEMKYYFATEKEIKYKSQSLAETGLLFKSKKHNLDITGFDIDVSNNVIYWSSELSGQLMEMSLDNPDKIAELSHLVRPTKISYDWVTGNVYILENAKEIKACSFKAKKCALIYRSEKDNTIESIAVAPLQRFLFWIEATWYMVRNAKGTIKKSSMSGGDNPETLAVVNSLLLGDLYVDEIRHLIYWSDKKENIIERCTYDGKDREVVLHSQFSPLNLMMFEDNFYWLNGLGESQRVGGPDYHGTLTKYGLQGLSFMRYEQIRLLPRSSTSKILAIKLHQTSLQPQVPNNCSKFECKELCVIGTKGPVCLCENGEKMKKNMECPSGNWTRVNFIHNSNEEEGGSGLVFWWLFSTSLSLLTAYSLYFLYNQKYGKSKFHENIRVWFPVSRAREEERSDSEPREGTRLYPGQHQYENPIFTVVK